MKIIIKFNLQEWEEKINSIGLSSEWEDYYDFYSSEYNARAKTKNGVVAFR